MAGDKLKIMVSWTVYGNTYILDQVKATLETYGYKVIMSKEGSVYVPIGKTNLEACLDAVEDCDLFLGIIFMRYGSGITDKEFEKAIEIDCPMWFLADEKVEYTRKLMQQFMYDEDRNRTGFDIQPTSVLDSIKLIDMYNKVRGKWVQPFNHESKILSFIEEQFEDYDKRKQEIENRGI